MKSNRWEPVRPRQDATRLSAGKTLGQPALYSPLLSRTIFAWLTKPNVGCSYTSSLVHVNIQFPLTVPRDSKEIIGCQSRPAASHCLSVNSTFATTFGRFFSTQATESLPFLFPSVQYLLRQWLGCCFAHTLTYVYRLCHAFWNVGP